MENKGTISNPHLQFKASEKLCWFIDNYLRDLKEMPANIRGVSAQFRMKDYRSQQFVSREHKRFENDSNVTEGAESGNGDNISDMNEYSTVTSSKELCLENYPRNDTHQKFISDTKTLTPPRRNRDTIVELPGQPVEQEAVLLNLDDLKWLYNYIKDRSTIGIYFHELFDGCEISFPKNRVIPRNLVLEERCQKLRNRFRAEEYDKMTKKVDCAKKFQDDTIAAQLKEIDRHLVAVFQLVVSVVAGFVFGFIGLELMFGKIELPARIIMGLVSALVIATAELYFLLKKISVDEMPGKIEDNTKKFD